MVNSVSRVYALWVASVFTASRSAEPTPRPRMWASDDLASIVFDRVGEHPDDLIDIHRHKSAQFTNVICVERSDGDGRFAGVSYPSGQRGALIVALMDVPARVIPVPGKSDLGRPNPPRPQRTKARTRGLKVLDVRRAFFYRDIGYLGRV